MSNGLGPGSMGPVTMRDGGGSVPGLPAAPKGAQGRAKWFFIGLTSGVAATLAVVVTVLSLTR